MHLVCIKNEKKNCIIARLSFFVRPYLFINCGKTARVLHSCQILFRRNEEDTSKNLIFQNDGTKIRKYTFKQQNLFSSFIVAITFNSF